MLRYTVSKGQCSATSSLSSLECSIVREYYSRFSNQKSSIANTLCRISNPWVKWLTWELLVDVVVIIINGLRGEGDWVIDVIVCRLVVIIQGDDPCHVCTHGHTHTDTWAHTHTRTHTHTGIHTQALTDRHTIARVNWGSFVHPDGNASATETPRSLHSTGQLL